MPNDQFYIDKRDITAHNLLDKRGFIMTLVSTSLEVIDPNSGVITTPATVTNTSVTGIMRFFAQDEINGVDILSGDQQALLSGKELAVAGINPDTTHRLIALGVTYMVVRVTPTIPGGIAVLHRLQVRR